MATDRNNGNSRNSSKNNNKRESLVLLHGDDNGESISMVHAFVRPIVWGIIWFLNSLLLQSAKESGRNRFQTEQRLIARVLKFVAIAKSEDLLERTRRGWLELLASDNPEQVKVLDEVASTLDCVTILFDKESGQAETFEQAASRLIYAAVLHPKKFVADNYRTVVEALVEAKFLSAYKASEVVTAALAERDTKAA